MLFRSVSTSTSPANTSAIFVKNVDMYLLKNQILKPEVRIMIKKITDVKFIIPHDLSLDNIFKSDPDFELKTRIRIACNMIRRVEQDEERKN